MIEKWGTEVALVIAILGTGFINWLLKESGEQHKSIKRLVWTSNAFCVIATGIYIYLAFNGVEL
jgi:uncharacterized membrane protein YozB (DUF420 family)